MPDTAKLNLQSLPRMLSTSRPRQLSLHCRCGRTPMVARGMCSTCYTLQRQDTLYFGGLRERVMDRDGRCCRVCARPGGKKRSLAVHHRVPGRSEFDLLITLCLGCHAKVTRTRVLLAAWPALLVELWREQHPHAHEQQLLDFQVKRHPPQPGALFAEKARQAKASAGCAVLHEHSYAKSLAGYLGSYTGS